MVLRNSGRVGSRRFRERAGSTIVGSAFFVLKPCFLARDFVPLYRKFSEGVLFYTPSINDLFLFNTSNGYLELVIENF